MDDQDVLDVLGIDNETTYSDEVYRRYVPMPGSQMDFGYLELVQWLQYSAAAATSGVIGNMVYDAAKTAVRNLSTRLRVARTARFTDEEAANFARYVLACAGEPSDFWNHHDTELWNRIETETEQPEQGHLVRFTLRPTNVHATIHWFGGFLGGFVRTTTCEVIVPHGRPDRQAVRWRIKNDYEPRASAGLVDALTRAQRATQVHAQHPPVFGPWRDLEMVRRERIPDLPTGFCGL